MTIAGVGVVGGYIDAFREPPRRRLATMEITKRSVEMTDDELATVASQGLRADEADEEELAQERKAGCVKPGNRHARKRTPVRQGSKRQSLWQTESGI